jgi:hypothetical protein
MRDCGTHYYGNLTKQKVDAIVGELRSNGVTVTGGNPWDVDTKQSGVKLRGEWVNTTMTLAVTVTDCAWYVPCSMIWEKIDSLMHHIQGIQGDVSKAV